MNSDRPNPDELLARVQAAEVESCQGRLRIFFGYAAGVGKTYAMLEAAQRAKAAGREIVIGYVEPHGRHETEALLTGLESVPNRQINYRGVVLREFDVDAAMARRPEVLVVDELAHTNAEGCRHAKRWQDVDELLEAGIDVWTTLNVQHIETLNDVIGQITGVTVRETIPDRVFEVADDLELVDITPEELATRLQQGKVYVPEQAQRAIHSFFQKSNLVALREMAFRRAAQRIHTDVETVRRQRSSVPPWSTADKLLVCVGPSPTTARVIRTAKRMATALDAPWLAVSVAGGGVTAGPSARTRVAEHFRLAERLGAETVTISGPDVVGALLEFARSRNVTKLFIGKTHQPRWKRFLFGTVVDSLLDNSGDIDVYIIHGTPESAGRPSSLPHAPHAPRTTWWPYLVTSGVVAVSGLIASLFVQMQLAEANFVMVFFAAVALVAYRYGSVPAILASVESVLIFDFFFVPPALSLTVHDSQYIIMFAVMLLIGLLIGTLTSRLKTQLAYGQLRERRTSSLYHLGKILSALSGSEFLGAAAGRQIADLFAGEVVVYLGHKATTPRITFGDNTEIARHPVSLPAAQWVIDHDQIAGAGTDTLPNAIALWVPLTGSQHTVGAVAVRVPDMARLLEPEQRQLLEACANQLALALERDEMALAAAEARIQAESQQLRNTLLNGVSHDLKTPLAAIAGASSSLLAAPSTDEETRRQLLETISDEAIRLHRLLENILQMSRLDAGATPLNRQWHVLEEIVGSALQRTCRELADHPVGVQLAADLPLIFVDGLLLEQLFVNLFENAARHTPAGTSIAVTAVVGGTWLNILVADTGPGLLPGTEERIFERFYRARPTADAVRGTGLGLAICRAVAQAHHGKVTAATRPTGGAEFLLRLPLAKNAPSAVVE